MRLHSHTEFELSLCLFSKEYCAEPSNFAVDFSNVMKI